MTYPSFDSPAEPAASQPVPPPHQSAPPPNSYQGAPGPSYLPQSQAGVPAQAYPPAQGYPYASPPAQPYAAAPYAGRQYPGMPGPASPMPYKDSTAAWLLWFFTGQFGGHHFYLGRTQRGVAYAITWGVSLVLSFVIVGLLGFIALFVLWIIDATQLSQQINEHNARAYAVNRSLGYA